MAKQQDPTGYQIGDKVRIRTGPYAGKRGLVQAEIGGQLEICIDGGELIRVPPDDLTNFSLAARRAWKTMPKRAGRPRSRTSRKRMVSLRLDVEVWRMLGRAAEFGLIQSREQAINEWLSERLDGLLKSAPKEFMLTLDSLAKSLASPSSEHILQPPGAGTNDGKVRKS